MSEISAYHEAGHAFMAIYVGARVRLVTIEPDWEDGPARHADIQVEWPLEGFTDREFHEKSVLVALAGPVAEMIHRGESYHPGFVAEWAADWKAAWAAAAPLIPAERKRLMYLEQTAAQLYRLLDREDHWAALAAIVDNLLATRPWRAERWKTSSGSGSGKSIRVMCHQQDDGVSWAACEEVRASVKPICATRRC